MPAQPTIAAYVDAAPTPQWFFRLPVIRDVRWLIAIYDQDQRLKFWNDRCGVPEIEIFESARIDAILAGKK